MGKTIGHAVLWPAPPAAPYRAGSPSHSSQPGSKKSLVITVVEAEKNSCSQARSSSSKHSAQLRRGKNSSQLTEDLAQGHSQDSTWPSTGPPPARITLRKGGGGRRGGARSCRRPPGPVSTREGMFLPPPARPARAACRTLAWQSATPGRLGDAQQRRQSNPPPKPPILPFLLCTKGSQGNPGVCKPGGQHLPQ